MPKTVLSIIESPTFPKLSAMFKRLGVKEVQVSSTRKAINALKTHQPDYIFAEFYYGYGNNYAGVNVSNLDVLLSSLPKYSPDTKTVVFVLKEEEQYLGKLHVLYPLHGAFLHNTPESILEELFKDE
jgi:hypothetical protein